MSVSPLTNYFPIFNIQLHEIDVELTDELTSDDLDCDVVCLMYDISDPRTFEYCAKMYKVRMESKIKGRQQFLGCRQFQGIIKILAGDIFSSMLFLISLNRSAHAFYSWKYLMKSSFPDIVMIFSLKFRAFKQCELTHIQVVRAYPMVALEYPVYSSCLTTGTAV